MNTQKLILWFIQSMLGWKYPFGVNLFLKIKTVRLFLNLLPELIGIWRIQWRCSFFLLFIGITLFGKIWSKYSN